MAIKYRKFILGVFIAALTLGGYSLLSSRPVYADSSDEKPIHLGISPVKQKLKLEPGQSFVSSFKVLNIGTEDFTYKVDVSPYSVVDQDYNADYESVSNDYTKMFNWVTIDENLKTGTLKAKSSVDIPFTITVPKDVPSGGQYAAITAETADSSVQGSIIETVNRLAMILYADISGATRQSGSIINNDVNTFTFEPPLTVSSLVENTGNVESTATYIVKVWPLGSNETVYNNEQNPNRFVDIIPDTRRFYSISWDGAPHLGVFTVEQSIEYLGQTSVTRKLVIICPLWLMLIIILVIVALVTWLVSRIVKRRKTKEGGSSEGPAKSNQQEERRI
ncbi:hypothetical protein IJ103_01685 [Candidatus Saccharibacteria bacterium]|nr:hypothetical protein [Candidatus Saccharibacteria bacterium]MBQ9016942.1 hypothetical protein [Candidatus Saccharibacteria bacterium]